MKAQTSKRVKTSSIIDFNHGFFHIYLDFSYYYYDAYIFAYIWIIFDFALFIVDIFQIFICLFYLFSDRYTSFSGFFFYNLLSFHRNNMENVQK